MARTIEIKTPDGTRKVVVDALGRPVTPTGPLCAYAGTIAGQHRDSLRCDRRLPIFSGVIREPLRGAGSVTQWCQGCEYLLATGRARDLYGRFVERLTER